MLLDILSIHSWIVNNEIKTESGAVLDFHNHRYLFDIYRDNSPFLCCLKAGQIGFSTMAILKTIWLSRNQGMNIGYILPTVEMVQKFVGSKVNGIARENPIISTWMKDKDSISLKQIDKYFIHSLGHGTGLEIHELPNLSPKSKDILKNNMVFSIEPGVYIPRLGGIRIEDLVYLESGNVKKFINVSTRLINNIF